MKWSIEDLGIAGADEISMAHGNGLLASHPRTGVEYAIVPTQEHGFVAVQPHSGSGVHVRPDPALYERTSRGAAQGPDGDLYLFGFRSGRCYAPKKTWSLLRWDWNPDHLPEPVMDGTGGIYTCLHMAFAGDGRLYVLNEGRLYRLDPAKQETVLLASALLSAQYNSRDQLIYRLAGNKVEALDPRTDTVTPVPLPSGLVAVPRVLHKDGAGRIILMADDGNPRDGETFWLELLNGEARPVPASRVRLTLTQIANSEPAQAEANLTSWSAFVFSDGSYISRIVRREITWVDPAGRQKTFAIEHKPSPLQLFSIEAGSDRLWLGTVLPLHLLSYAPATGQFANHGTPLPTFGEIYNMVWSGGRLFFAGYTGAYVARLDPARPLRFDRSPQANPHQLGPIREDAALQRIHGRARDPEGNVYFAAKGDYGCEDSGLCRIDIHTERMHRWIFPDRMFGSLTYLPQLGQLLVAERRKGDEWLRFLFVDPVSGQELASEPVLHDHGDIVAWLHDGGDWVYGLHDYRATLFAYSLKERRIVKTITELGFGHHCKESLLAGPDRRIWGVTHDCIFAVDRALETKERLGDYDDKMLIPHSRFGFCYGPDGAIYFLNGPNLMRLSAPKPGC